MELEQIKTFFTQLWSVISTFWNSGFLKLCSNILDILLVAFIVYHAVKLIRETRAIQLLKGILLLAVLYVAVNLLKMEAMMFLLQNVFEFAVIGLLILFQPELRHALESMGRSKFGAFNLFSAKGGQEFRRRELVQAGIDGVCRACADMSDKKIGALIIFERVTMLGEIAKTGTTVDALVSPELIGNIFYPKAPLHDGGAIIRDGRVCAAGCILPLTQNNAVSSELGTRHRAALGMSEQSDAIVVVVSEERGSISIAHDGVLTQDISDGDLREKLQKYLITEPEEPGEIGRTFKRLAGRIKHEKKHKENEKAN